MVQASPRLDGPVLTAHRKPLRWQRSWGSSAPQPLLRTEAMLSRCSAAVSLVLHFPSCLFSPLLKCLFSSEHLVIPSGPRPHRAALCLCAVPYSRGRFTEMEPCVCGLLKLALFTEEPVTLCLFQANLLFVFLRYLPDACSQIYVFVRSAESRTQSLEHVA